ncbi:MAG: DUF1801 domain-containing protein [Candidatus Izemoplasmatales bacterium]
MNDFADFLLAIPDPEHRAKLRDVLERIAVTFPTLGKRIAWNQPTFTDHGTFILAFSASKNHFSVAPEKVAIDRFGAEIDAAGYGRSEMLFRIRWTDPVDFPLLEGIIRFNLADKATCRTFWRQG